MRHDSILGCPIKKIAPLSTVPDPFAKKPKYYHFRKRSGSGHKNRKPDPVGALHYGVPNVGPKGPPKPSTGVKRKSP